MNVREAKSTESTPKISTKEELVATINILSNAVARVIRDSKKEGESYGPEVVAALAFSIENILEAAKISPTSILRLGMTIVTKEIWETCHSQYGIEREGEPDVIRKKSK